MTKFHELKSRLRSEYPDQKDALDAANAIEELEEALRPFSKMQICSIMPRGRMFNSWEVSFYGEQPHFEHFDKAKIALGDPK